MEGPEHTDDRGHTVPTQKKPDRREDILYPSVSTQCLQLLCFLWLLVAAGVYCSPRLMGRRQMWLEETAQTGPCLYTVSS